MRHQLSLVWILMRQCALFRFHPHDDRLAAVHLMLPLQGPADSGPPVGMYAGFDFESVEEAECPLTRHPECGAEVRGTKSRMSSASGCLGMRLVVAIVALVSLVPTALVVADDAQDDHGELLDEATLLTSSAHGEITPGDEGDVFRIEVTDEASWVTVYTTGDLDTTGILVRGPDQERLEVLTQSDGGGDGGNFWIEMNLGPGTYFVGVVSEETGQYVIHVRATDAFQRAVDDLAKRLVKGIIAKLPAGRNPGDVSIGVRPLSVSPDSGDGPSALPDTVRGSEDRASSCPGIRYCERWGQ